MIKFSPFFGSWDKVLTLYTSQPYHLLCSLREHPRLLILGGGQVKANRLKAKGIKATFNHEEKNLFLTLSSFIAVCAS